MLSKLKLNENKVSFDLTECAICQEKFLFETQIITQLECKHVFHRDCIWSWITTKITRCADTGSESDRERFTVDCPLCNFPLIKVDPE